MTYLICNILDCGAVSKEESDGTGSRVQTDREKRPREEDRFGNRFSLG